MRSQCRCAGDSGADRNSRRSDRKHGRLGRRQPCGSCRDHLGRSAMRSRSSRAARGTEAVGIIPARWSSTRFPGKPLHLIAGKPLLQHVWKRCRQAKDLNAVIVATDDMRVAEAAFSWGAEVALTSPTHRSGTDRIAEVARNAKQFAFVINIQGDEPLIDPRLIDKIVEKLRADRAIQIVTAAHRFENPKDALSPHQVKVAVDLAGNALYFSRAPIPFHEKGHSLSLRHQGIYGFRRNALLQFVKWKPTPLERAESLEQL